MRIHNIWRSLPLFSGRSWALLDLFLFLLQSLLYTSQHQIQKHALIMSNLKCQISRSSGCVPPSLLEYYRPIAIHKSSDPPNPENPSCQPIRSFVPSGFLLGQMSDRDQYQNCVVKDAGGVFMTLMLHSTCDRCLA